MEIHMEMKSIVEIIVRIILPNKMFAPVLIRYK